MAKKQAYSLKTGMLKSIKNVLVVWGIPALLLLINNWQEWVPTDYNAVAAPIMGLIAYLVKNYIQNK